jgi:diacylglycerol kinase (ATP)
MKARLHRLSEAFKNSLRGIQASFRSEKAFQEELVATPFVLLGAILVAKTGVEAAVLVASWLVVLITELLNTGIEEAVNRVGTDWNAISGKAKDAASAAVLFAVINWVLVWVLVLFF